MSPVLNIMTKPMISAARATKEKDRAHYFACAVLLCALLSSPPAVRCQSTSASELIDEGQRFENSGDNKSAIRLYSKAISVSSNSQLAFIRRAKCRLNLNDIKGALADLGEANRIGPPDRKVYAAKHAIHQLMEDWQLAIADADAAIKQFPNDGSMYVMRAYDEYKLEQWGPVAGDTSQAIELLPPNHHKELIEAYRLRIMAFTKLGLADKVAQDEQSVREQEQLMKEPH